MKEEHLEAATLAVIANGVGAIVTVNNIRKDEDSVAQKTALKLAEKIDKKLESMSNELDGEYASKLMVEALSRIVNSLEVEEDIKNLLYELVHEIFKSEDENASECEA